MDRSQSRPVTWRERVSATMMGVIGVAVATSGLLIRLGVVGFASPAEDERVARMLCGSLCVLLGLVLVGSALTGLRAGRVVIEPPRQRVEFPAWSAEPSPRDLSRLDARVPGGERGRHDPLGV